MAQKVNPIAVRLNRNRVTDSSWFSDYYYAQLFHQDLHIRNYLYSIKQPVGNKLGFRPARCVIHHYPKRSVIHLFCLGASEVSSFASVASNRSKGSSTLDSSKAGNSSPYEHLSRSDHGYREAIHLIPCSTHNTHKHKLGSRAIDKLTRRGLGVPLATLSPRFEVLADRSNVFSMSPAIGKYIAPHHLAALFRLCAWPRAAYKAVHNDNQDIGQQQLLLDWQKWLESQPQANQNQRYSELLNTANEIGLNEGKQGSSGARQARRSPAAPSLTRRPPLASHQEGPRFVRSTALTGEDRLCLISRRAERSVEPSSAWQSNLAKAERLRQPKRVEGCDGNGLIDAQQLTEKSRMAENQFLTNSGLNYFVMQYWFQYRSNAYLDVNWTFKHLVPYPSSKVHSRFARPSTSRNYYLSHIQSLLSSHTNTSVSILPIKVTSVYQSAALVAQEIACKLEHTKSFRQICKTILKQIDKCQYIKGIRISCSGRLNGAEIAKTECKKYGETSLHVFSDQIDYAYTRASTPYGILGVKVWICYL